MALDCRIVRDTKGNIDYVNTEEGTRSALFDNLARVSTKKKALELYALTETEEFKNLRLGKVSEPSLEEVLNFSSRTNDTLTEQQITDVENTILSSGLSTYGELMNQLKTIFYKKGIIVFDRGSLEKSGFYNDYEINSILDSTELQEKIRLTLSGLSNSEDRHVPDYDSLFVVSESGQLNSLGKQIVKNPFLIEKEITEALAGVDVSQVIDTLPFENVKNQYYSDLSVRIQIERLAQDNARISEKVIVDNELVDKTTNRTKETLEEVLDLADREVLLARIDFLSGVSGLTWETSKNSIYTLLKDLNTAAIDTGVDFLDIQDLVFTRTQQDIIDLLQSYRTLLLSPSEQTLNDFSEKYSEFFNIGSEPSIRVVKSNDSSNIYLESELSEYQLFVEQGLIKQAQNIYKPVEVIDNLDDVYSVMIANKNLLPIGVETEQELRDYVEKEISSLDIPDFKVDVEQLEKMVLYKMYFGSAKNEPVKTFNSDKYLQFTGDYNYLTQEYPSDFYKQLLKEKKQNSDSYKNFYSNFVVTKNGIELLNDDPITVQNIMRYASEEFRQYNLLSRTLNLPTESFSEQVVDFNEMIFNRQQAISNPELINKLDREYTILSPITIAVKNANNNFVRTPVGVFEIDYQIGNVTFYNMLPKGDVKYNSLGLYKAKTQSDLNLDDFAYLQDSPELFTKSKNYYSETELKKINEKHFGCL